MTKKKKTIIKENIENLSSEEEPAIEFVDTPVLTGEMVADFSFEEPEDKPQTASNINNTVPTFQKEPAFKRCYVLTKSTLRKVDELKAIHPALTTYVSDIVEYAINYYYDYIMKNKKG